MFYKFYYPFIRLPRGPGRLSDDLQLSVFRQASNGVASSFIARRPSMGMDMWR
jgi:hypothetical protein